MAVSPEDRFLTLCSRVDLSAATCEQIGQVLHSTIRWDYVRAAAIGHAVAPLLRHSVRRLAIEHQQAVPSELQAEWEELYRKSSLRNRRLEIVLQHACASFESAGIELLGLKDVQLSREVYPDPGLRPIGDLDLLIHPEDYDRAADCLAALGFLPETGVKYVRKYGWAHHFVRQLDNVWIDLQWNVCQREWDIYGEGKCDVDIRRIWRNSRRIPIGESSILVPSNEDMLVHLCLHLEGHRYCELILLCDIAELIRTCNRLDWNYVLTVAMDAEVHASLYYPLLFAKWLLDAPVPDYVLKRLSPEYVRASWTEPLFDHLAPLHQSLDELDTTARAPDKTMHVLEQSVRRQASASMQVSREVEKLIQRIVRSGSVTAILDGEGAPKIFPEDGLDPFGRMTLLVCDEHVRNVCQAVRDCDYRLERSSTWSKEWNSSACDPVLTENDTVVAITVQLRQGVPPDKAMVLSTDPRRKRTLAKEALKRAASGQRYGCLRAVLNVNAVSPEQILLYHTAQLGASSSTPLFRLCSVLEFFRMYKGAINWRTLRKNAEHLGVLTEVSQGLGLASELVTSSQRKAMRQAFPDSASTKLFDSARYDQDAFGRYSGFRGLFYVAFTILRTSGRERVRYLRLLLSGDRHSPLFRALREAVPALLGYHRRPGVDSRNLAYWTQVPPSVAVPKSTTTDHAAARVI